jgi:hypothetical protein
MNPFAIFFRFGRIGRLGRRKGNQPGGPQRQEKTNVGLFVIEMAAERVPKLAKIRFYVEVLSHSAKLYQQSTQIAIDAARAV